MSNYPEDQDLEERIRSLLAEGQKIEAIRVYREATAAGLAAAKEAAEALEQGHPLPVANELDSELRAELLALLQEGQKIEAIKLYRDRTAAPLASAKALVEALARGENPRMSGQLAGVSEEELLALLEQGQKIEAIKLYRERTGAGLKDAKDAVEAIGLKHGLMSKRAGCAAVLLAFLPVLLGFYFLTPR